MENLREIHDIELPRAKGAYLEEAPDCIWTQPGWVLEVKMDGTRESLQIGTDGSLFVGRNRQDKRLGVDKAGAFMVHDHPVFSHVASAEFAGTILDGECTLSYMKDGQLDELTRTRQQQGIFTGYTVWGCLWYKGRDVRNLADSKRRELAAEVVAGLNNEHIRLIERFPATREKLQEIWNAGEEGAIAKRESGIVKAGQRTCPTWFKLKTANTVDAFITGVTEGTIGGSGVKGIKAVPSQTAASFTMSMIGAGGEAITVCKLKNLPDDISAEGFRNFSMFQGKVAEMCVSGWNGKSFRWARFIRWRDDKKAADCIFSEQVGGKGVAA